MLEAMLVHQFRQQAQKKKYHGEMARLARDVAAWACREESEDPLLDLREFLGVAEFLGRREKERRDEGGNDSNQSQKPKEAAA